MANDETIVLNMPYTVTFNSVLLGYTTPEGVKIRVKENPIIKLADQYGKSPIGVIAGGHEAEIDVQLEQYDDTLLKVAFPASARYSLSTYRRNTFGRIPGRDMTQYLKALVLHRASDAASAKNRDWKFYKAMVTECGELTANSQSILFLPVKFMAFVDTSKSDGGLLCEAGDANASTLVES